MKKISYLTLSLALLFFAAAEVPSAVPSAVGLGRSNPVPNATLAAVPASVVLHFIKSADLTRSVFKVYPLPTPDTSQQGGLHNNPLAVPAGQHAKTPAAKKQAAARALVDDVLASTGDEGSRADLGHSPSKGTQKRVRIALRKNLKPGDYVVMWRVVRQTGNEKGFYTFSVEAPTP